MDAVFTWNRNKKTYIFKGPDYWRFDERTRRIDTGYPKEISKGWPDIVDNIDAAVTWSNWFSYVFKGNDYWKLKDYPVGKKVYAVRGYPKKVTEKWMKCKTESVGALTAEELQVDP